MWKEDRHHTTAAVFWGTLYSCQPETLVPALEGRWKRDIELSAAPMPNQCSPALIDSIDELWSVMFFTHLMPSVNQADQSILWDCHIAKCSQLQVVIVYCRIYMMIRFPPSSFSQKRSNPSAEPTRKESNNEPCCLFAFTIGLFSELV